MYCPGMPVRLRREPLGIPETARTSFIERLSDANTGSGHWQSGWRVTGVRGDALVVRRRGLAVTCPAASVLHADDAATEPGSDVEPPLPQGSDEHCARLHVAIGNGGSPDEGDATVTRWYWNLTAAGASAFMRVLTAGLNEAGVPFQLKVLSDPATYRRCDAACSTSIGGTMVASPTSSKPGCRNCSAS